ncbi:MAG: DUF6599 family protein [Myxococcota bacterium]
MDSDRLFIKKPWKHYRRRYSSRETQLGAFVLFLLLSLAAWVVWMGTNPDPELFTAAPGQANRSPKVADRGPIPPDLAPDDFTESSFSRFGPDDLYEKINGRESYYKSFGFEQLYFVGIRHDSDPTLTVDVEIYDQGTPENALGAFSGELAEGSEVVMEQGMMHALRRNAFVMVRGPYYVRAIGSLEGEPVAPVFASVKAGMSRLEAAPLPWAYDIFVGSLGVAPQEVRYLPQAAFSFDFATEVYAGLMDDQETEAFVRFAPDSAAVLAERFNAGFEEYGSPISEGWVQDRYLGRVSGARARDEFVVGVRNAASASAGEEILGRVSEALDGLSPRRREELRSLPSSGTAEQPAPSTSEDDGPSY